MLVCWREEEAGLRRQFCLTGIIQFALLSCPEEGEREGWRYLVTRAETFSLCESGGERAALENNITWLLSANWICVVGKGDKSQKGSFLQPGHLSFPRLSFFSLFLAENSQSLTSLSGGAKGKIETNHLSKVVLSLSAFSFRSPSIFLLHTTQCQECS